GDADRGPAGAGGGRAGEVPDVRRDHSLAGVQPGAVCAGRPGDAGGGVADRGLYRDINQTLGEAKELAGKYRAKSLAVLTQRQNFALYNLRMALRLNFAAREAAANNLIEDPFGAPGLERIVNSYGDSIGDFNPASNDGL
ncbi:MAG: hypothetical protein OXC19_18660, partial [Bryobacterales bacterium]|nr:hypothetical protein [Bryobacterales bacterium]